MSDSKFCGECFEEFRLDDTGGYNPPCRCGWACRSCCDAHCEERDVDDYDADDPDEADPTMPGRMP